MRKVRFQILDRLVSDPEAARLSEQQVELAWRYAARFFFEYPFAFPWHLLDFWDDIQASPPELIFQARDGGPYAATIRALLGEPIEWARKGPEAQPESVAL